MKIKETIHIPIGDVVPDKDQPRKLFEPGKLASLRASVKKFGVMTPVTVEKVGDKFLLVDGERRFRVSKDLGLETIPATVIEPQNEIERLVQQFHIQEQHEEWTATEKASSVYKLSSQLGTSVSQICELLSISDRTAHRYLAFAGLLEKKEFVRNEIGLEYAQRIEAIKKFVQKLYIEKLEKELTPDEQRGIEKAIIKRVANGDIKKPTHLTKMVDSFKKQPSLVQEFIDTDISIDSFFLKSKAHSAYYLRNGMNNLGWATGALTKFLQNPEIALEEDQIVTLKKAKKVIQNLLDKTGAEI